MRNWMLATMLVATQVVIACGGAENDLADDEMLMSMDEESQAAAVTVSGYCNINPGSRGMPPAYTGKCTAPAQCLQSPSMVAACPTGSAVGVTALKVTCGVYTYSYNTARPCSW